MKLFVTGGSGFIGSHIVKRLVERGDDVTVLSRQRSELPWPVRIVVGDLWELDPSWLAGHDACIHCAVIWGEEAWEWEMRDLRATVALYRAAEGAGVGKFIYTSSVAVHRPFDGLMDELFRMTPPDVYGATKAATETFLSAISVGGSMKLNAIRPGPTVGAPAFPGGAHKSDRRIVEMVRAAQTGEPIIVAARDARQFVGVEDLARLYLAVLDSDYHRQAFVGLAREPVSWEEIARKAIALAGMACEVVVEDHGLAEMVPAFTCEKIKRVFGFEFDASSPMEAHLDYLISGTSSRP